MSILLEGLAKSFRGTPVVRNTSLEIEDGELFVLLGASGSGKSTILRMIAGLTIPDRGRISLRGRDVTYLSPQERGIGFVFQNYSVFRHMSVAENIAFPLRIRGVRRAARRERCDALLDLVGLGGLGNRFADQLSGGQQQRVALARALAHEPSVLLLDEPFGALDVKIRGQLRRSLREIQRQLGVTAILVTHDQEEAFELADRVGLMDRGEILEVGRPDELYLRPRTLFGATFLGSGTVLVGRAKGGQALLGELALPIPPEVEHEENGRVRVLFRPEEVEVLEQRPESPNLLGVGRIVERSFLGATRRVRVRMAPIEGTRQVSPSLFGEEGLLIDVNLPAEREVAGDEVFVRLRNWHVLAPPRARLLGCVAARPELPVPEALLRRLMEALGASTTLLAVTPAGGGKRDAPIPSSGTGGESEVVGPLDGLDVERSPRRGAVAREILAEEAGGLYDFLVLQMEESPSEEVRELLEEILGRLSIPLLLARKGVADFQRLLICTAVGEPGKSDVRVGGWLARRLGAQATLLHVRGEGRKEDAWVGVHLGAGVATLRALEVRAHSMIRTAASPGAGILAETSEGNYDLIVIGRHNPRPGERPRRHDLVFEILAGSSASLLLVPPEVAP